jgi:hypothetical protein
VLLAGVPIAGQCAARDLVFEVNRNTISSHPRGAVPVGLEGRAPPSSNIAAALTHTAKRSDPHTPPSWKSRSP